MNGFRRLQWLPSTCTHHRDHHGSHIEASAGESCGTAAGAARSAVTAGRSTISRGFVMALDPHLSS